MRGEVNVKNLVLFFNGIIIGVGKIIPGLSGSMIMMILGLYERAIDAIFNSPGYVYKANIIVKLNSGTVNKKIIGKNNTHIITIDNELIPIKDILDIDFSN